MYHPLDCPRPRGLQPMSLLIQRHKASQYAHSGSNTVAARPNRSLAHSSGPTPQQNLHYELALQQPRQQQHNTSYGSINQNSQPNISAKHCAPNQTDEEYWRHKRDQRNRLERSHKQENLPFAGREPSRGNGDEEEDEEDGEKGDGNP
ncbi:hypothetical protein AOQ84DRAFT_406006 [Glonium stellatum]|uniref:Uncharacterized protein n=1 Tax=Glonium stellatum TaxID=574774 RepID=A0A8E2F266_9PEZI|nr:hypothetical protein AOQ84DRAFT_406006 [Glonium stellatum]